MANVHGTSFLSGLEELRSSPIMQPVRKEALFIGGDKEISHQAIMRGDEVLSVVKPTYEIYQNTQFLTDIEDTLKDLDVRAAVKDFKSSGSSFGMLLDFPDFKMDDPSGNKASYQLLVRNSYDATSSVAYISGLFRFVCLNMMTVGVTDVSIRTKHTGNLEARMTQAMGALKKTLSKGPKDMSESMKALGMTIHDPEVFRDIVHTSLTETAVPDRVLQYSETPLAEYADHGARKEGSTAYGALCVISDSITHGTRANVVAKYDYLRRSKNAFYDQLRKQGIR